MCSRPTPFQRQVEHILALLDWRAPARIAPVPLPLPTCPGCGKLMFLIGPLPRAPT